MIAARPSPLLVLVVLGATLLAGCADPIPAASAVSDDVAADVTVAMIDNVFEPATIEIAIGDVVRFENRGQLPHNVYARDDSFRTKNAQPGESVALEFVREGEFPYLCSLHPKMTGTIRVVGDGAADQPPLGNGTA